MDSSSDYERGLEAFHRGTASISKSRKLERVDSAHFVEAWELLLPLAQAGLAEAQTLIGCMYDLGLGTEPSASEAAWWYERAAAQGDGGAASNLCSLHQTGRFGDPDEREIRRWWKRATELGFNTRAPYPGDDAPI
jgi:TPR repeat protein